MFVVMETNDDDWNVVCVTDNEATAQEMVLACVESALYDEYLAFVQYGWDDEDFDLTLSDFSCAYHYEEVLFIH